MEMFFPVPVTIPSHAGGTLSTPLETANRCSDPVLVVKVQFFSDSDVWLAMH